MTDEFIEDNLISVIVPVYNCEKYVGDCLDSILANKYQNLEVIVVNDGSTDNSAEIIKKYYNQKSEKYDNRVIYIEQNNMGLSVARNTGIKYADGDWISFVDADDIVHPLFYWKMMSIFEFPATNKDVSIAECGIAKFQKCDLPSLKLDDVEWAWNEHWLDKSVAFLSKSHNYIDKLNHLKAYPYEGVMQMNKLYNRRIFDYVEYPEGLFHEDEYVIYEEMKHSRKVAYVNLKLYGYRVGREGSITNTVKPKNLEDMVTSRAHVIETVVRDSANMELSKADANDWIRFELTKMLNDLIYMYPKVEKTEGVQKAVAKAHVLYKQFNYTLSKRIKYELFFKAPKVMEIYIKVSKKTHGFKPWDDS